MFRLIFANAREGIAIIQDGHIRFCNPWLCRMLGYTEEELISRNIISFVHPEDRSRIAACHRARVAGEDVPESYEFQAVAKNGTILWMEVAGHCVEWEGRPASLNFFRDISKRKRAEHLVAMTAEAVNDGIWDYDLVNGKFHYSDTWAQMLGYGQGEVSGERCLCRSNIHPDDAARFHAAFTEYIEGRAPKYEITVRLRTRTGDYKWVYSRGKIVERDIEGKPLRVIGADTDIHVNHPVFMDVQDRLQELVEHLSIGVAVYRAVDNGDDFVFVDFNRAAERITLISRDKVIGQRLVKLFPRIKESALFEGLQEVWKTGESRHLQPFYYEDDVRRGWRENRIYRIPSGEVVALFEDVTERKLAEEALRASEHQKELILNSTSEVVTYCDTDLRIVWTNLAAARALGKSSAELKGLFCHEAWHQRDTLCDDCPVLRARETKVPQQREMQTPDGRYWLVRGYPVLDARGEVIGLAEFTQDITEARKAENALTNAMEKIKLHVENSPLGVIEWEGGCRLSSWSSRAEEIFGWSEAEVLGKNWSDLSMVASDDLAEVEVEIGRLFSGAVDCNTIRNCNYGKDGRELYCIWYNSALRDDAGNIVSILSLVEDVTESMRAQKEKLRMEEQFHQVQKLESVGRLAGGVAHDLNNLLSPILGYGEMLLRDSIGGDPRKESLEQIVKAGMRARDLVRQLLAFSRKQALEFKSIDVQALLENFEKLLRRTIREDIALQIVPTRSLSRITGDVGQLEQVVMNLVVNAQDAMPEGGTLTIGTEMITLDGSSEGFREDVVPGSYVVLTFTDTGCGMDKKTLAHLFEPFFTTKEKDKGTGLGLATVYGIVSQHGGTVTVSSEPGVGTSFRLYLPAAVPGTAGNSIHPSSPAALGGGSETILLVEDNEPVRDLVFTILQREGYKVLVAESGSQALSVLEEHTGPVQMLLTDVIMPGMNGKELFRQVSALYPDLKVLYMSGYTDDVTIPHGVMDGGGNFIQKPFSITALAVKIRAVLEA